jgi:hypothetical protein
MNRVPLDYLVGVGLAQSTDVEVDVTKQVANPKKGEDGQPDTIEETSKATVKEYSLTDEGKARASEINYSGIAAIHSNEGTVLVNANGDVMVGGRP